MALSNLSICSRVLPIKCYQQQNTGLKWRAVPEIERQGMRDLAMGLGVWTGFIPERIQTLAELLRRQRKPVSWMNPSE